MTHLNIAELFDHLRKANPDKAFARSRCGQYVGILGDGNWEPVFREEVQPMPHLGPNVAVTRCVRVTDKLWMDNTGVLRAVEWPDVRRVPAPVPSPRLTTEERGVNEKAWADALRDLGPEEAASVLWSTLSYAGTRNGLEAMARRMNEIEEPPAPDDRYADWADMPHELDKILNTRRS